MTGDGAAHVAWSLRTAPGQPFIVSDGTEVVVAGNDNGATESTYAALSPNDTAACGAGVSKTLKPSCAVC